MQKSGAQVALAAVAQLMRERREVALTFFQALQRRGQAQALAITVLAQAGMAPEGTRQVKQRTTSRVGHFMQRPGHGTRRRRTRHHETLCPLHGGK